MVSVARLVQLACLLAATPAHAYAGQCRAISDNLMRLACYDRHFPGQTIQPAGPVTAACEEALSARLKAPATYIRIGIDESRVEIPLPQWTDSRLYHIRDNFDADAAVLERQKLSDQIEEMRLSGDLPVKFSRRITYDASNAMGVPLRATAHCIYESSDGSEAGVSADRVTIDMAPEE